MSSELPAGFRWLPGMVARGKVRTRHRGSTVMRESTFIVHEVYSDGAPAVLWKYDSSRASLWIKSARIDDATPVWGEQTNAALLRLVRNLNLKWFAISCQYRGSVEEWNVVARAEGYAERNRHAILGAGPTEHEALCNALARVMGVVGG